MGKYKLTWKDLTWHDFKTYLFAMFKAFIPKSKIKNLDHLEEFIQTKSAWVTQVTLYGYLIFFSFSFLKVKFNYSDVENAKKIFLNILDDEVSNKMPQAIIEKAKKDFYQRIEKINWDTYHNDLPFNPSALSLYEWAPISEELKTLDRKIVLNSVILKWDVVKKEFKERLEF